MKYKDDNANILVINCGSSSLKYKLIAMPQGQELICGEAERVGIKTDNSSFIRHSVRGKTRVITIALENHEAAFRNVLALLKGDYARDHHLGFNIFAHRYVHPGAYFNKAAFIDKRVLKKLKDTLDLAPIHNPVSYKLIKLCNDAFSRIPQCAVFDTAFHTSIPKEFSTYALNAAIAKKYGLHKVGFHGISHKYVMQEACSFLKREQKTQRIISCHLGSGGSSVCAIAAGKSVNSSMGFTPLEGLMMNTRSGDIDIGLFFYIMFKEGLSARQAEDILNKKSGILGIFDTSSDLRDVFKMINQSKRAHTTFSMYVRRVKKYIGFYSLILKKADIIIFTDSLGVHMPFLREKICQSLGFLGIFLDKEKNNGYRGGICDIAKETSQARILIVPTNEEMMIACETYREYCHDSGG